MRANALPKRLTTSLLSKRLHASKAQRLPEHVDTVIVGGGVIGASVAYHLSKKANIGSILLLEQAKFTSGTTWHAAGLVGCLRGTGNETQLSKVGQTLYQELEKETGLSSGYKNCGSVTIARTPDRMQAVQMSVAKCKAYNVPYKILSPEEVVQKFTNPTTGEVLISSEKLVGGLHLPMDGSASPTDLTLSLMEGAKNRGVTMVEGARVNEFGIQAMPARNYAPAHRRVTGVAGTFGEEQFSISANRVILTAGQWSRQLAEQIDVNVPLHSAEHYYMITKAIPGIWKDMPVGRDPDAFLYFREWSEGLCLGGFEPKATPIWTDGAPQDFEFSLLEDNWDAFMEIYEGAMERFPCLESAEVRSFVNGPESFTLDNQYILGEAPEVSGFFLAAGFNSSGIASAGGAGAALADWVALGHAPSDLSALDIRRFGRWAGDDIKGQKWKHFLRDRTAETLGLHYAMPWPRRELQIARELRLSPLHERLRSKGACFGQKFGWERANFFAQGSEKPEMHYTFGRERPTYFASVERECLQTRNSCSLFDMTSFGKHIITGSPDVLDFACTADIKNAAVGRVIYTQMLNSAGGIEADVTIIKLAQDKFMMVSATASVTTNADWIRRVCNMLDLKGCSSQSGPIEITDVTDEYAVLALMGPRSRDILAALSGSNEFWSDEAFPFGTFKDVCIENLGEFRAQRVSYVGELGWELCVTRHAAGDLHDALFATASDLESSGGLSKPVLAPGGYYAIESLRLEKGYRAWGHDIGPDDSLREAGLTFTVNNWDKEFLGKEALLSKSSDLQRRLLQFQVSIDDNFEDGRWKSKDLVLPWGGEPIYLIEGEAPRMVGYCQSSNVGFTLQQCVHMGYVKHENVFAKGFLKSARFEIELFGKRYPATASLRPSFDPQSRRLRGVDADSDDPVFMIRTARS